MHYVAIDGHQTMKRHTTIYQKTVFMMGGGVLTRQECSGMYVGDDFTSFGVANEATKDKENKTDCGLRRPPDDKFDTTTN